MFIVKIRWTCLVITMMLRGGKEGGREAVIMLKILLRLLEKVVVWVHKIYIWFASNAQNDWMTTDSISQPRTLPCDPVLKNLIQNSVPLSSCQAAAVQRCHVHYSQTHDTHACFELPVVVFDCAAMPTSTQFLHCSWHYFTADVASRRPGTQCRTR